MNIKFFEIGDILLMKYQWYEDKVSNNDLLELNSYKIRNILSIAFNTRIKNIILEDLFNETGVFLTIETKQDLFKYLSLDERNDLRNYLSEYLDFQIQSDWFDTLCLLLKNESINIIVIPTHVLNNVSIMVELKKLFPRKKFVDWRNYNEKSEALILDYNHAWKKRNIFTLSNSGCFGYFLKHFFENTYQWKEYNDNKHLFQRMNTPTRNLLIGKDLIAGVKETLSSFRPRKAQKNSIFNETEHSNYYNPQEEIIIHFDKSKKTKYRINSSFLLAKDNRYVFKHTKELVENPTLFETQYTISNLENIITLIDLDKLNNAIEKDRSVLEAIQPLWDKHSLKEEDGRLWKQLLNQKTKEHGLEKVFSDIEEISGVKKFVSLNTFESVYCSPENSTIIPREKKIFKTICKYLGLPIEYRAAIHRERNLIGGNSQELNGKLKDLIKAILACKAIDKHSDDLEMLNILEDSIDQIENKVDMDFFGLTKESLLYACVEVCYEILDNMKLKPIFKIEHIIPN